MRISKRAEYAVRAMVDLALFSGKQPVSLKEISTREGIPLNYLEQLFFRLKNGKIVTSVRGPGGGYRLGRECSRIKIRDIITTVEEPLNPLACLDSQSGQCPRVSPCMTHTVWHGLGERIRDFLASITLEELVLEARHTRDPGGEEPGSSSFIY